MPPGDFNTEAKDSKNAVWALTPQGAALAAVLCRSLPDTDLFLSASLKKKGDEKEKGKKNTFWDVGISATYFDRLSHSLSRCFHQYSAHIFIMSAGIVVRMIAPLIRHKTLDPAVVVMDERGIHAISLLSGHMGGANELAEKAALITGANPVISTATDINHVPAIDLIAKEAGLLIENPQAIRHISMALLKGEKIFLHDPRGLLKDKIPADCLYPFEKEFPPDIPGVYADEHLQALPPRVLILRPPSLAAGMGCNRGTDREEMKMLLLETLARSGLSRNSVYTLASVDLKKDEEGLLALAAELRLPLVFFSGEELNTVTTIENPSAAVEKHIGAQSVCEAAAILASGMGKLMVPKRKTRNVTLAVAGKIF